VNLREKILVSLSSLCFLVTIIILATANTAIVLGVSLACSLTAIQGLVFVLLPGWLQRSILGLSIERPVQQRVKPHAQPVHQDDFEDLTWTVEPQMPIRKQQVQPSKHQEHRPAPPKEPQSLVKIQPVQAIEKAPEGQPDDEPSKHTPDPGVQQLRQCRACRFFAWCKIQSSEQGYGAILGEGGDVPACTRKPDNVLFIDEHEHLCFLLKTDTLGNPMPGTCRFFKTNDDPEQKGEIEVD